MGNSDKKTLEQISRNNTQRPRPNSAPTTSPTPTSEEPAFMTVKEMQASRNDFKENDFYENPYGSAIMPAQTNTSNDLSTEDPYDLTENLPQYSVQDNIYDTPKNYLTENTGTSSTTQATTPPYVDRTNKPSEHRRINNNQGTLGGVRGRSV